ncbi:hypothetical protein SSX86_011203 [Deinandra increscens subsp. villosa]|uniref:RRM domain-containing protein n=1 Tax=Deinandra increscens subsp. villosa TaxID=3103831 RepID=A0AAP0H3A7_9ASTR
MARERRVAEKTGDGEGWQTVRRRRIDDRLTFSFFISSFPESTSVADLWKVAQHLGRMEDAFISRKRRFNNECFGFIHFKGVNDVPKMERRLNELYVGGRRLKANISHVPRRVLTKVISGYPDSKTIPKIRSVVVDAQKQAVEGLSYRDAMMGFKLDNNIRMQEKDTPAQVEPIITRWKKVQIPDDYGDYPSSFFHRALLGEAKDEASLCSIKLLKNEGDPMDFDVVYVGGMHILLVFNHKEDAVRFKNEKETWWRKYLVSLEPWEGQAFPRLRIVGLKILGVPLHLRDDSTYEIIAEGFGSSYTVMVKEEKDVWTPKFEEEERLSSQFDFPGRMTEEGDADEAEWDYGDGNNDWGDDGSLVLDGLGGGGVLENTGPCMHECNDEVLGEGEDRCVEMTTGLSKERELA